ncbi:hypothetical protein Mia14_0257 [Candidatus Mancarchaeum acidiphilum]|uniref:Uncharacterized protein n=1 Tax=Candidatus Mancarchaeum acidiphilum TaxID=1920749 RepID=A0A218NM96_9ARCH|nr:hypothetical protein [Candidatus Mancarchaeum acidiphilum]ASI13588.1 hypothetical protein Mia14_0257 [Candidatus Mancarchaeum acidiphilum]
MKMQVSFEIVISMAIGILFISSIMYMYMQVNARISDFKNSLNINYLQSVFNSSSWSDKYLVIKMSN